MYATLEENFLKVTRNQGLCDKAYRERLRVKWWCLLIKLFMCFLFSLVCIVLYFLWQLQREKMDSDLRTVGNENEDLKRENERLRSEKDMMDQSLQERATENQRLQNEICCSSGKISQRQVLVDAFSRKLLLPNHADRQLLMLRQETALLHGNVTWNDQMEEQKLLLERKINLEHQSRSLKIQVQAQCEMIYNEKNHQERQL
ncbi:uncharacterized protein LOC119997071 [Tripterygium wilfordii]|uniref:uncharacterized protein LOC119997071 n=1 Tax=Tripterygium wilfordii TaxID=458696 RepID=UPI0018F82795|nr:uncharacterized protein LOC119997071 [Tripterygium wilfordii]